MDDKSRLIKLKEEHLEHVLIQWIYNKKKQQQQLDDNLVLEQAKSYLQQMNINKFSSCDYSELWLQKFKKRRNINYNLESEPQEQEEVEEQEDEDSQPLRPMETRHSARSKKSAKSALKKKKKMKKKSLDYDSDEAPLIRIKQEKEESPGYFMSKRDNNQKRKHVQLTISEKVEVLKKMAQGVSDDDLIREYKVGRATLYDIRRKKNKLYNYYKDRKELKNFKNKKSIRCGKWPQVEDEVFKWYVEQRTEGHLVTDQEIMNQAKETHSRMGYSDDFLFSATWLRNFKLRRHFKQVEAVTEGFTINLDKIEEMQAPQENNDLFVNEVELNPLNIPVVRRKKRSNAVTPSKPKPKPIMRVKQKPIILSSCQDQELKPIVMQLNNYIFCQTENDIFGKYVSCQLENMTVTNRCTAQERIQAILSHYRLQAANRTEAEEA